ncbi:MAG: hypothetical protein ILM98_05625 [Kiritimatiellae bacterium]|nr:hypothetical protein [Kiritimatiellia bacterium]
MRITVQKATSIPVGRLATTLTAAMALSVGAARADVYSNAVFWARGIGVDYETPGRLAYREISDSLNRQTPYGGQFDSGSDSKGNVFTNTLARLPYRGVDRIQQSVYFAQTVTVTNQATGEGTLTPGLVSLPATVRSAIANRNDFAFAVRVRPDIDQACYPGTIIGIGYGASQNKGFSVSFGAPTTNVVDGATNILSQLRFTFSGNSSQYPSSRCAIAFGDWNDIVLSVRNGTDVTVLVSRGGNLWDGRRNSDMASWQTTVYSFSAPSGKYAYPDSGGRNTLLLGAKDYASTYGTSRPFAPGSANDITSVFRGCFQSVAVWTNALSVAEMREAVAWPRTDLWRVGIEDGDSAEFNGSGASATVVVDEDHWMLQKTFAAGASATFRFPLDSFGEAQMPQLLRVKAASGSFAAKLAASVNGTTVGTREITAGGTAIWHVPAELLAGGVTNAITIVRTDSGASAFKFDAVSFGGSIQYGLADGGWCEFGGEAANQNGINPPTTTPQTKKFTYDLVGGNWLDGPRAFYRSDSVSSYTYERLRFDIPKEVLATDCRWRLKLRMLNEDGDGHKAAITLNDRSLGEFAAGEEHDISVPKGLVVSSGNMLIMQNTSTGGTGHMAPDYLRIYLVMPPTATVMSFR